MKAYPYCELIGKLLYLAIATCLDIAYVIGVLCCFIENPGMDHWHTVKCVLCYLRGTIHMKLIYLHIDSPDLFTTYSNADLSGNLDNSQLTGGFTVCIGGGVTQWGSCLQPHVSLSSTESKYTTASKVSCKIMCWTCYLFDIYLFVTTNSHRFNFIFCGTCCESVFLLTVCGLAICSKSLAMTSCACLHYLSTISLLSKWPSTPSTSPP
jgi:hypothetical protein